MTAAPLSACVEKSLVDRLPLMHLCVSRSFWRDGTLMGKVRVAMVTQASSSVRALVCLRGQGEHVLVMVPMHEVARVACITGGRVRPTMTGARCTGRWHAVRSIGPILRRLDHRG